MNALFRLVLLAALICGWDPITARAQTTTAIPFAEAPQHVGQHATVEGIVAKVFTSKIGNTPLSKESTSKSLAESEIRINATSQFEIRDRVRLPHRAVLLSMGPKVCRRNNSSQR
jgi:hypothetical protein